MGTIRRFTSHQIGALITLLALALWGVWVSWLPLVRPMGITFTEILFLSALVPIYVILLPFYGLRVRWSYLSGILVMLGLLGGYIKSLLDHTFFFSPTLYNFTTLGVLLLALSCIYLSVRSYYERPPVRMRKSALGIGCLLAVSIAAVWWVSNNQMTVENYVLRRVIQGVQARTGNIGERDQKVEALMAEGDIPSMAGAIVVGDEILWLQGYGEANALDTMYDIGSITKPIIATAVFQLHEREQIDLDDDIYKYLPFSIRHPDYPNVPITIRMLLANQSCLAHNTNHYYAFSMGSELRQWGVENRGWENPEGIESLSYPKFIAEYLNPGGKYFQPENWARCQPGTKYVYSTPGFDVLGYLVEQVSGQPIDEYLYMNVFAPLEMTHTTATPLDTPENMATPFERWYGVLAKTNLELPLSQRRIIGGGGLYATAGDLANFLLAHMNQGKFGDYQMLQPETVALMHQVSSETYDDFAQIGYGYGWSVYQKEPRQMWDITFQPRGYQGHGGRTWGYSSAMYMVEEDEGAYGYILLMNHSMVDSMDIPMFFSVQYNIQDLILNEAYRIYKGSFP